MLVPELRRIEARAYSHGATSCAGEWLDALGGFTEDPALEDSSTTTSGSGWSAGGSVATANAGSGLRLWPRGRAGE